MPHLIHFEAQVNEAADEAVASLGLRLAKFLSCPFQIVLAMRSQREREAAQIAEEFHCGRHIEPSNKVSRRASLSPAN
jgi:hypothetical protein